MGARVQARAAYSNFAAQTRLVSGGQFRPGLRKVIKTSQIHGLCMHFRVRVLPAQPRSRSLWEDTGWQLSLDWVYAGGATMTGTWTLIEIEVTRSAFAPSIPPRAGVSGMTISERYMRRSNAVRSWSIMRSWEAIQMPPTIAGCARRAMRRFRSSISLASRRSGIRSSGPPMLPIGLPAS
jgi:hypothetical protein